MVGALTLCKEKLNKNIDYHINQHVEMIYFSSHFLKVINCFNGEKFAAKTQVMSQG